MGRILDPLKEWGCANPDEVGTPEYRALYETLAHRLASVVSDASIELSEVALDSLNEFVSQANRFRRRIVAESRPYVASPGSVGRLGILNWRKHGDDESYCRLEVFSVEDLTEPTDMVEKEHNVRAGAEDEGDYDATYYVNDDIPILDGEIMTSHDGRWFRVGVLQMQ